MCRFTRLGRISGSALQEGKSWMLSAARNFSSRIEARWRRCLGRSGRAPARQGSRAGCGKLHAHAVVHAGRRREGNMGEGLVIRRHHSNADPHGIAVLQKHDLRRRLFPKVMTTSILPSTRARSKSSKVTKSVNTNSISGCSSVKRAVSRGIKCRFALWYSPICNRCFSAPARWRQTLTASSVRAMRRWA